MTQAEFLELFPDADASLDYLKRRFYPDGTSCPHCDRSSKFHRIRGRSAYSCQFCGTHVYPTSGTIFHKSPTNLQVWFWAIFLLGSTRGQLSTRELERELGVSYKTARRMREEISRLLFGGVQPAPTGSGRTAAATTTAAPAAPPPRPAWHGARRRGRANA